METLEIKKDGAVATVTLNRPDVRNAFNERVISELTQTFESFSGTEARVRVAVLTGAGKAFSAGADVEWMRKSAEHSKKENAADAGAMARMFRVIDSAPCAVVGRVNGHALGGALGLIACCDVVIAAEEARLGFTEVRLGILPAVISPFVLQKVAAGVVRRYFLTGERFSAATARAIGLVHEVVAADQLDAAVQDIVFALLAGGPKAVVEAKALVRQMSGRPPYEAAEDAVDIISRVRVGPEAQEGLRAFLEKRKPTWPSE